MSDEAVEQRAKDLGWIPQDEYKGPADKFIDADAYLERGEQLLPLLRADKRKLEAEVARLRQDNASTRSLLDASAEAIAELKSFNSTLATERVKAQKTVILEKIQQARSDNDAAAEAELTDQLSEVNQAIKDAGKPPVVKQPVNKQTDHTKDPTFVAWMAENPWFNKNIRQTAFANGVADEMRADPETYGHLKGKEFLDRVSREVAKQFGGTVRNNPSKVAGDAGGADAGGGGGGRKSFADLPADARAACTKQGLKLVGAGRAFKTEKEWQAHYVAKYFE